MKILNHAMVLICSIVLMGLMGCGLQSSELEIGGHRMSDEGHSSRREHSSGSGVEVHQAWIRATPPNAKLSAAYLHLMNHTEEADALVSVSSPLAETAEIHNSIEQGGMMKMFRVERVEVPAKSMVAIKPGSFHVMLIGLKQQPQPGQTHVLMLHFEKAGMVKVEAKVLKSERAMDHGNQGHGSGHDHKQ